MWCSHCQQDVPGLSHSASGRVACSRCQHVMRTNTPAATLCDGGIALDDLAAAAVSASPPKLDDWQSREQARKLGRALRRSAVAPSLPLECPPNHPRRLDPPANLFDNITHPIMPAAVSQVPPAARRSAGGQLAAWLIVVVGAAALCGGLGMIAWSLAANRTDFWNLALGLTVGGQGILIFGLVLVVSRLWRNSRYATGKLHDVHLRLGQVQRTADALAATRPSAPAFYADLARGGSPAMLMANLKGQVEQLATQLGG